MAGSNASPSFVSALIKLIRDYSGKSGLRREGNLRGVSKGWPLASENFVGKIQRKLRQKRVRHDN